jgi:hypothetical protein
MRRLLVLLPQIVVAVVAGVAVGLLWLASGDDGGGDGGPPAEAVTATGRFDRGTHAFGEMVTAHVDVVVDNRSVQPESIRVDTKFAPYEVVGLETVERVDAGATSVIRFSYPLRCLGEGCDPGQSAGMIDLETGRVLYRFQGQPGDAVEVLDWPSVQVTGRVDESAVTDIRWRANEAALAAPTYRTDPVTTAAVLFAFAIGLALLAAWLAWRLWHTPTEAPSSDDVNVVARTALERALDSALAASRADDKAIRRRSLERVSRELMTVGLSQLAADASVLAWSPQGSTEDDVEELAHRSVAALNGGDRA